ncbi:hypothetical protein [Streptomyces sp. NPDC101178]|uniref:hypothetical protein n=1 Tax=Streptomyces sp. NPDC101178 TaxID=3366124 RepID=UPI003810631D
MGVESDLREIRRIPVDGISDWIRRRFPDGSFPQWWLAVFESLETSVSPLRDVAASRRRGDFELSVEVARLAVDIGGIRPPMGAYWILRLAAIALRFDPPVVGLPELLMPDGAAELALNRMPLSRERAIAASETRKAEYLAAGDDFYAPVGSKFSVSSEVDVRFSALQEVELILSALPWVSSAVTSKETSRNIDAWLEIRDRL